MFFKRRSIWLLAISLALVGSAPGQIPPSDLDDALRKNLDNYVFKGFSINSRKEDQYGLWVCGRINIQIWAGGVVSSFTETDFVGQIFPKQGILGKRSVITAAGPLFPAGQETYDKYCK